MGGIGAILPSKLDGIGCLREVAYGVSALAEPKDPALPKMREWPMFRPVRKRRRVPADGRAPPKIADLIMEYVPGSPARKLAWLREQMALGKLDADDSDEIAQAEALLLMLCRISASRDSSKKHYLDDMPDERLRDTFPASDPVAIGRFTSTEPLSKPIDSGSVEKSAMRSKIATRRKKRAA